MTVKELLQSACGENRNMTTFAEEISQDIPVSASTLYRLAAGETRKAIPAELLQAIIKHADPNSTVTFDELETAFRSQCRTVSRSRRMSKALLMENLAKAAIFETALDCGAAVSKASPIIADPKTGEKRIYDSALLLKRDDVNQTAYFEIKTPRSRINTAMIDRAIGQILREDSSPDKYYYLVIVSPEHPDPEITKLLERLSGNKMSLNLSIVSMAMDGEGNCNSRQVDLGAGDGIMSFN